MSDEQAIRELVAEWMRATEAGDIDSIMDLIADDVVFMVPGQPPFGKEQFRTGSQQMKNFRTEVESKIAEVKVAGEWGWFRSHLNVAFTPNNGGRTMRRSGYVLTIVRKRQDGRWEL